MKHKIIIVSLGVFFIGSIWGSLTQEALAQKVQSQSDEGQGISSSTATNYEEARNNNPYRGLSDQEFHHVKVKLPDPKLGDWNTVLISKQRSMSTKEGRSIAAGSLGNDIRLSLRDRPEQVPAMLDSLIELVKGDPEQDVETAKRAALSLYLLGDYHDLGLKRMEELLKSVVHDIGDDEDVNYKMTKPLQDILNELLIEKDHRLDETIYNLWNELARDGRDLKGRVDFAFYLEKTAKHLPTNYWIQRLNSFNTLPGEPTIEVLNQRISEPAVQECYKKLFSANDENARRIAAGPLYKITHDSKYLDFLEQEANKLIAAPSGGVIDYDYTFSSLIMADANRAFPILKKALNDPQKDLTESVSIALSKSKLRAATDLLFQAGIDGIKKGKAARYAAEALVNQNTDYSIQKYKEYKEIAEDSNRGFGPKGIWPESDFYDIEFKLKRMPSSTKSE
jgi:hypothetical protein